MLIKRPIYFLISLTLFSLFLVRLINIYLDSNPTFITVIPDDAFYYLQLAKNYSQFGKWSFDGQTLTTGFHPLYANLLTFFFDKNGNSIEFKNIFLIIGLISSILITTSLYAVLVSIDSLFDKKSALIAAAPFFSYPAFIQSTSLMEAPLVIFIGSMTIYIIFLKNINWTQLLLVFLLGIAGSLARSDFIVFFGSLSFFMATASLQKNNFYSTNKIKVMKCISSFIGIIIGLSIVISNNYLISGKFAQGSAEIKYFWSKTVGHSVLPALKLLVSLAMPLPVNFYMGIIILLIVLFLIARRKYNPIQLILIISSIFSIIIYICILSFNSQSIQSWYVSNLIIPFGIILSSLSYLYIKSIIFNLSIILLYIIGGISYSNIFVERHQIGMLSAAYYLKNNMPLNKKYAAWNSGIIGFFSDRTVINLDGLVNDNAITYIKENKLWNYILDSNIDYIIDYGEMFSNGPPWKLESRGGHDDIRFHKCLKPGIEVDSEAPPWIQSPLKMYEIDRLCT